MRPAPAFWAAPETGPGHDAENRAFEGEGLLDLRHALSQRLLTTQDSRPSGQCPYRGQSTFKTQR
jgi:hypothetical protein